MKSLPMVLFVAGALVPKLVGQCGAIPVGANVLPGTNSAVRAMAPWDPDGAGPRAPGVVLGGRFTVAGEAIAGGVAFLDPQTMAFSRLGTLAGEVTALAVAPQGPLFAAHGNRVSRWNGVQWVPIALSLDAIVYKMAVLPNGDLVIGGSFVFVDGVPLHGLARWNGATWGSAGFTFGTMVYDLLAKPNGDLLVVGDLYTTTQTGNLAQISGSAITFLAGAPVLTDIELAANGDLVASAVNPTGVFRQSGGVWTSLTPMGSPGGRLHVAANGDIVVTGAFATFEGVVCRNIARLHNGSWGPLGAGIDYGIFGTAAYTMVDLPNLGLLVGGNFLRAGDVGVANLALWDGTLWSPMRTGLTQGAQTLLTAPNGDVFVGGDFLDLPDANGQRCQRIARRTGDQWFAMGSGLDGRPLAMARLPNGDLVVGGAFSTAGGVPCSYIARWNGVAWSPLGAGMSGFVHALAVLQNGDLVAGGYFGNAGGVPVTFAARWDGSAWHAFGAFDDGIEGLCVRADGSLLAAGRFSSIDGVAAVRVAQWSGGAWSALGAGLPVPAREVVESAHGEPFAIAGMDAFRFDGTAWQPLGLPVTPKRGLLALPDGSVLVGTYTNPMAAPGAIHRFDGTTSVWATANDGGVAAMALAANGVVWCGGIFSSATSANGSAASPYLVQLPSACPAAQVPYGVGCASSGGVGLLSAVSQPWLGGTWRARATGLPTASPLAVQVIGFPDWPTPLSWVIQEGQAGCSLMVDPVLLDVALVAAGAADARFPVPPVPALAGQSLALQVLPFELAGGALTGVFATNALLATVGSY